MPGGEQPPEQAPLARAHRLASAAEELYEEGRWQQAIERFEAASDAYVSATLATTDTTVVQSLRLMANSHSQRAHELRLRTKLHGMHEVGESLSSASASSAAAAPASPPPPPAGSSSTSGSGGEALMVSGAFARLSSQLISTHEELRFGAEELSRILLPAMPGGAAATGPSAQLGASSSSVLGAKPQQLIDSFYVVPPSGASPRIPRRGLGESLAAQTSSVLSGGGGSGSGSGGGPAHVLEPHQQLAALQNLGVACEGGGGAATSGGSGGAGTGGAHHHYSLAQLAHENSRLMSENAALKQRASELTAVFSKVQRRAADQQRLARKALSALREVHNTPRPDLPSDAAKEIADLRRQLEAAHTQRRQQAELVRKYEQRWAQLKASARRKQAAQQQEEQQRAAKAGSNLRPQ